MPRLTRITPADHVHMPWKNGKGSTAEIAVRRPAGNDRFLWRLSLAQVPEDGPFSDFSGYDRTLVLIEGTKLGLDFGSGRAARLEAPYAHASFAGDWPTVATLAGGPVADLNIMTDRARAKHKFTLLTASTGQSAKSEAGTIIVHALSAASVATLESGEKIALNAGDTLVIERDGNTPLTVTVTSDAAAAQVGLIEISAA